MELNLNLHDIDTNNTRHTLVCRSHISNDRRNAYMMHIYEF